MLIAFTPDCATTVGSPSDKTVSVNKTVRLWIEKSNSAMRSLVILNLPTHPKMKPKESFLCLK